MAVTGDVSIRRKPAARDAAWQEGCSCTRSARFSVEAEAAGTEGDDVEEPAGHHQVLVEMDHVVLISRRQMHATSSAQADKGEQSGRPSGIESHQQGQAAEQVDWYRGPDRNIGCRHVNAGEILRCAAWIAQHDDAVPDEQARHQQSCEGQQEGFTAHSAAPFKMNERTK
jgi:hypothetical protein